MPVIYNGKKIIPAPIATISKEYQKSANGEIIGTTFSVVLNGKFLYFKGSPDKDLNFHEVGGYPDDDVVEIDERFTSILRKQEALRDLFADEGQALEFTLWEASPGSPVKCYPRIISINFEDGTPETGGWHTVLNYTINMETDEIFGLNTSEDSFLDEHGNKLYISDAQESWNLEFNEQPQGINNPYTFRLTHNVSAVGKRAYDSNGVVSDAWVQARSWVNPKLGFDNTIAFAGSGIPLGGTYNGYNHTRTENTDERAGSYAVTETWLLSSGNTIEDFTVTKNTSIQDGLTRVSIDGSITGLDTKGANMQVSQSRWEAALSRFNSLDSGAKFYTRATNFSGITNLNANSVTSSIGKNPNNGIINYTFEFDTRPSNCISGALSERITINETNSHDVYASIGVPGKTNGSVLQAMNTVTDKKFAVSIEVTMPAATGCPVNAAAVTQYLSQSPSSQVANIVNAFETYLTNNNSQVFKDDDTTSWQPIQGSYSRNVSWTYQNCS